MGHKPVSVSITLEIVYVFVCANVAIKGKYTLIHFNLEFLLIERIVFILVQFI